MVTKNQTLRIIGNQDKDRKWDNYLAPVLITDQAPARELQHLPGQQAKVTPSSCGFKVGLENINQLHIYPSFHRVRLLPHSVHPRYVSFANLLETSQVGSLIVGQPSIIAQFP